MTEGPAPAGLSLFRGPRPPGDIVPGMDTTDSDVQNPNPVDPAAIVAMVAATGQDQGIVRTQRAVAYIGVFGGIASALNQRFGNFVLLTGLLIAYGWLVYCRVGQSGIARKLLDRFGVARFRAAQPIIDQANRYINETE